jgi:tungstate transport system substrate-binding protein
MKPLIPAPCSFAALTGAVEGEQNRRCNVSGGFMFSRRTLIAAIALGFLVIAPPTYAQDKSIVVASTTSTQDSGLFEYLLPIFKQKTGITVKVLAQGTGQALDTARRGDADVVFVHAK